MSYPNNTPAWTRKQANVLYAAFMRGTLKCPEGKRPGFVYDWVGRPRMMGTLGESDLRNNKTLNALNDALGLYFDGNVRDAQRVLDFRV